MAGRHHRHFQLITGRRFPSLKVIQIIAAPAARPRRREIAFHIKNLLFCFTESFQEDGKIIGRRVDGVGQLFGFHPFVLAVFQAFENIESAHAGDAVGGKIKVAFGIEGGKGLVQLGIEAGAQVDGVAPAFDGANGKINIGTSESGGIDSRKDEGLAIGREGRLAGVGRVRKQGQGHRGLPVAFGRLAADPDAAIVGLVSHIAAAVGVVDFIEGGIEDSGAVIERAVESG